MEALGQLLTGLCRSICTMKPEEAPPDSILSISLENFRGSYCVGPALGVFRNVPPFTLTPRSWSLGTPGHTDITTSGLCSHPSTSERPSRPGVCDLKLLGFPSSCLAPADPRWPPLAHTGPRWPLLAHTGPPGPGNPSSLADGSGETRRPTTSVLCQPLEGNSALVF